MSFTTGTISQPDAGSVGLAMAEKIRDELALHAAWELVEEFTVATGQVRWYVFRNLASVSGLPADFYMVMGRTLATGELRFSICETYNQASRTMSGMPIWVSSTTVAYDAAGRHPATYVLGTAVFSATYPQPKYTAWIPSGTSTKWWIIIHDDTFTVAMNGASNNFVHLGAFIPITVLTWDMPLMIIGNSFAQGGLTRNPAIANAASVASNGQDIRAGSDINQMFPLGVVTDLRYNDKLQGNQRPVAEVGITISNSESSPSDRATYGHFVGKQKRMRYGLSSTPPAGMAFGDAYALQGRLWVPYLPSDTRMFDTGVASS